ncbi:MAG: hypothetical protein ABSE44_20415 [Candidatus Sulfotelmatobacter sp.]
MSIQLLPASANPLDPSAASDVSTSLVPLTPRALATRASQTSLVPSTDTFAWSSPTRPAEPNRISGTLVEDSQSDEAATSGQEYVNGSPWSRPVETTAAAQYLFYAAAPAAWTGRLINLYA